MRRNLRGSPVDCKKLAYISLVRSGMEYASLIWDPYTKADSNKLEKDLTFCSQMDTFIIFLQNQCHSLEQLQLESLEERRKVQQLAFMYKILNGQVAVPAPSVDLILSSMTAQPVGVMPLSVVRGILPTTNPDPDPVTDHPQTQYGICYRGI